MTSEPFGTLGLTTCGVQGVADWYSPLFNPATYGDPVYCQSEVVYPRFTIVLLFLMYATALLIPSRALLSAIVHAYANSVLMPPIYGALYYMPLFVIAQALLGGLICASWPPADHRSTPAIYT